MNRKPKRRNQRNLSILSLKINKNIENSLISIAYINIKIFEQKN